MIIITHYDRLYDERQTTAFKASDLVDKLFRDTVSAYAAVLDFTFSLKKHISGGSMDKAKHVFKDFFNAQAPKFQAKLSNIADLKAKILESNQGAFQDKTMQQFGSVPAAMDQLQRAQSDSRQLQLEQRQILAAILEDFKELKDSGKRKTPLDYLIDEFVANKKKLAPLPEPYALIDTLLATKHGGTCAWILQNDHYQAWSRFDKSTILCLAGGPRSGKSTIIASLVQQLKTNETSIPVFVNYVSCVGNDSSQTTALLGQKSSRICNTLLCQIYDLAAEEHGKISLLETCNQILRNSKNNKATASSGPGMQGDEDPDFVDAMARLVTALQRDTVLIIDAVEDLSSQDQIQLYKDLQELVNDADGPQRINVLIGGRLDSTFIRRAREKVACIDTNDNNQADMQSVLSSRLRKLSGLSENEKQQDKESVLNKAGSRFSYIDDVAIPFLEQPFQRPIATYLSKLPEGMNESFEQAIQSMPQNYFDLLRLAVTWSLFAPWKVTVKEVIEAYSGVYTVDEPHSAMMIGFNDDSYDPKASALEIQQIRAASGPFLSTEIAEDGQIMVTLQNARQVRTFCEHAAESHPILCEENAPLCDNCKSTLVTPSRLIIDPKVAHYEIALVLLKHLNSPLFQKRFGLLGDPAAKRIQDGTVYAGETHATDSFKAQEVAGKDQPVVTSDRLEGQDSSQQDPSNSNVKGTPDIHLPGGVLAGGDGSDPVTHEEADAGQQGEDSNSHTEPSIDGDYEEFDYIKDPPVARRQIPLYDRTPELRCEINNWPYHLQEAERLWPVEQRKCSGRWIRLNRDIQEELGKFVSNQVVFQTWQKLWGSNRVYFPMQQDSPRSPLHIAACLGLSTWAETLIHNGADINEISGGTNVIQASAELVEFHQNVDLLRLLLQHGADPYHVTGDDYHAALHLWLIKFNNLAVVKAFVDHEVNFGANSVGGITGLRAFAWNGHEVGAFGLIVRPNDPSKKPDINAEDRNGGTALHRLLWRREVPLDLLEAFLAVEGIDVNHDDETSRQPLSVASCWGSLDILKVLLQAKADVHDRDINGCTALHGAAQGDHMNCIEALSAANSELDSRDEGGCTALHYAACYGRKAAVELLVDKGSEINSTDIRGHTPFFDATDCSRGGQESARFTLTKLKEKPYIASEISRVTKGRRTPLRQAARHGFADVLQELLEYVDESEDADVKATINKGDKELKRTPLHCAALRGDPRCVQLLLKHGADTTLKDVEGNTPLVMARGLFTHHSGTSYEKTLLYLIDADRQAAIEDAELPSIAAANGSLQVLQKLHSMKADLHRTDSFGWTPLAHAKQSGHKEVEHFLKHEASWGGISPSKWADEDSLCVLDNGASRLTYREFESVRFVSDKPLPPSVERFYYEITLEALGVGAGVTLGFCTHGVSPHEYPGRPPKREAPFALSWGYSSYNGGLYYVSDHPIERGETYGSGDTVGCGVNLESHKTWFTKNGKKLDHEFEGVKGMLFPILGLFGSVSLRTNFGQECFLWKDENHVNGAGSG